MTEAVYTLEQLIATCAALRPAEASQHSNGAMVALCTTDVIRRVIHNGELIDLDNSPDGRICGCYLRISTEQQRTRVEGVDTGKKSMADGWSEADQITRFWYTCIENRWPFRIFSDAALSGGLPYHNAELIRRMREKKAERYEQVFSNIFLTNRSGRHSEEDINSMRQFCAGMVEQIRTGKTEYELLLESGQANYRRTKQKRHVAFRPALTCLMDNLPAVHTVLVQDLSRISRSYLIVSQVVEGFHKNGVKIQGILQKLDFVNSQEAYGELLLYVLGWLDGLKLDDVLIQNFRSIETILLSGRPFARISCWLYRDDYGIAHLDDGSCQGTGPHHQHCKPLPVEQQKAPVIRELVRLFIEKDENEKFRACSRVASTLGNMGYTSPMGRYWTEPTVKSILQHPSLIGKQPMFGKDWDVLPPLISDHDWWRINQRWQGYCPVGKGYKILSEGHLLTGLLKCCCGRTLSYRLHSKRFHQYTCDCEPHERRVLKTQGIEHPTFSANDVDLFFEKLMEEYSHPMLMLADDANDGKRLQERLAKLMQEVAEIERHQYEQERELRPKVAQEMRQMFGDNPKLDMLIQMRLEAMMGELIQQKRQKEGAIRETKEALEACIPADGLAEQIKYWGEMSNAERNRFMRTLFDRFEYRVQEDGSEVLVPFLRTASRYQLPPIRFKVTIRGKKCRRMPPVNEWVKTIGGIYDDQGKRIGGEVPKMPAEEYRRLFPQEAAGVEEEQEHEKYLQDTFSKHPEIEADHIRSFEG